MHLETCHGPRSGRRANEVLGEKSSGQGRLDVIGPTLGLQGLLIGQAALNNPAGTV